MAKAFDRVSWHFLRTFLLKFGFHPAFVQLILNNNNIYSSWFSILLNGSYAGFFKSSRGLKQGLSPYLFILLTDAFSRGLKFLMQEGTIHSYGLPRGAPPVSHLSFADDLILFTRGHRRSLRALFYFLSCYERASGQLINKEKSFFVSSSHCSPLQGRVISGITGIRRSSLPFRYLGCNLYTGRCKKIYFSNLVQNVRTKLDG